MAKANFNGVEIPPCGYNVKFNGNNVNKLNFNGVLAWERFWVPVAITNFDATDSADVTPAPPSDGVICTWTNPTDNGNPDCTYDLWRQTAIDTGATPPIPAVGPWIKIFDNCVSGVKDTTGVASTKYNYRLEQINTCSVTGTTTVVVSNTNAGDYGAKYVGWTGSSRANITPIAFSEIFTNILNHQVRSQRGEGLFVAYDTALNHWNNGDSVITAEPMAETIVSSGAALSMGSNPPIAGVTYMSWNAATGLWSGIGGDSSDDHLIATVGGTLMQTWLHAAPPLNTPVQITLSKT